MPKRIITNYYDYDNEYNNMKENNINKNLFTNYNYKRIKIENNYWKDNNNKSNIYNRNIIAKTPLIRRCKTLNNVESKKNINNNISNGEPNNNLMKSFNINNKYKFDKIDLNAPKDSFKIKMLNRINSYNNNKFIKKESINSVKYSITNDGSTVSIYSNTIHGLPIIQGVCAKCINSELIKLKNINKKIYNQRNEFNNNIFLKKYFAEKEDLIKHNSTSEFNLNKSVKENLKQKVIMNYLQKEQNLKNKMQYNDYNMKSKVDKYLINGNKISKLSIPCIGLEKFRNKYLPTKEQYINNLNEQIILKKKTKERQNKKDKDEFNFFLKKNLVKDELDKKERIQSEKQKLKELLKENIKLAELKRNKEFLDKSYDIALEKKYIQINDIKDKEKKEKQWNMKFKIRLDLKEKLEEQINNKIKRNNSFNFRSRIKRINSRNVPGISDINIYTENKINQYGRCFNCKKLFKKNLICPKNEYDNIKNAEKRNEQEFNNILGGKKI